MKRRIERAPTHTFTASTAAHRRRRVHSRCSGCWPFDRESAVRRAPDPAIRRTATRSSARTSWPATRRANGMSTGAGDADAFRASRPRSASIEARRSASRSTPTAANYRLDIYRMGYYGGSGARKWSTIAPSAVLPQTAAGLPDRSGDRPDRLRQLGRVGVVDGAGRPPSPASISPRRSRTDTGGASHIVFIVRDDASHCRPAVPDVRHDLAGLQPVRRQQPLRRRARDQPGPRLQGQLQPAVHDARNDSRRLGLQRRIPDGAMARSERLQRRLHLRRRHRPARRRGLQQHKVFLSVGHDEYWSGAQRANVEAARDAGVHLAFFSGNEMFWKTRWENSISAPARRTARWSATRKPTPTPRSIRRPTSGPARGAIRASAHRPTAAGRRTR